MRIVPQDMTLTQRPPVSNTGAETAIVGEEADRALIDWAAWTFKEGTLEDALVVLNLYPDELTRDERGGMGYLSKVRAGNVAVYFDGQPGMGVHVEMTGQGCREFEARNGAEGWRLLTEDVLMRGGQFTRLDLAIDDFSGQLDLGLMERELKSGAVVSRFKGCQVVQGMGTDGASKGQTIYFGSSQSRIKCRFYDKAAEQQMTGHWVRAEVQMRDERAQQAAVRLCSGMEVGEIAAGVLKNYIKYAVKTEDGTKSRWPMAYWWETFLGEVEKLKLTTEAPKRTIETVKKWLDKQVAAAMALVVKADGGTWDFIFDCVGNGLNRLKPRHLAMIPAT